MAAATTLSPTNVPFDFDIRKLSVEQIQHLSDIMSTDIRGMGPAWKVLMGRIRKSNGDMRFTNEQIRLLEDFARAEGRPGMEVLIDEWGTMGRANERPTVSLLWHLCKESEAIRAADYIKSTILDGREPPPITLVTPSDESQPTLTVPDDVTDPNVDPLDDLLSSSNDLEELSSGEITNPFPPQHGLPVHNVRHEYLKMITCDFARSDPSRKIGSGGFAEVYLGITKSGKMYAVKKLKDSPRRDTTFNYEVATIPGIKHPNILELVACSNDCPEDLCLVYPYMSNDTLENRLAVKRPTWLPLTAKQRLDIATGIASGLDFLHSQEKTQIHRDIKSSNILLNDSLIPKIADFGLLHHGTLGTGNTIDIALTNMVQGTFHYMSPESQRGDINAKMDVYAFGIVLFEILSGQAAFDDNREDKDMVTYITYGLKGDSGNIEQAVANFKDPSAGWNLELGIKLFELGEHCIQQHKAKRPSAREVYTKLTALNTLV